MYILAKLLIYFSNLCNTAIQQYSNKLLRINFNSIIKLESLLKKINKLPILLLLLTNICYSQKDTTKYNDAGLTRLTFGIHVSNYKNADVIRVNPETNNIGGFDLSNSQGFFINYKFLKFRNHSLKAGLFLDRDGNVMNQQANDLKSRQRPFYKLSNCEQQMAQLICVNLFYKNN